MWVAHRKVKIIFSVMNTWHEQQRQHLSGSSVSCLQFDPKEGLLWAGGSDVLLI